MSSENAGRAETGMNAVRPMARACVNTDRAGLVGRAVNSSGQEFTPTKRHMLVGLATWPVHWDPTTVTELHTPWLQLYTSCTRPAMVT